MKTVTIEAPDKKEYTIEIPEGGTRQGALEWFQGEYESGNATPDQAPAPAPAPQSPPQPAPTLDVPMLGTQGGPVNMEELPFKEVDYVAPSPLTGEVGPARSSLGKQLEMGSGPKAARGTLQETLEIPTATPAPVAQPSPEAVQEPSEAPSGLDEFMFGFESTDTDVNNGALWLESRYPLGEVSFDMEGGFSYQSPDELYGEGFEVAEPEQRREFLNQRKQKQLMEKYPDLANQEEQSGASVAGSVFGTLATPTTLAFGGVNTLAGFAKAGAVLGSEHSALRQLADEGKVRPSRLARDTAIGAAGGLVGGAAFKGIAAGYRKVRAAQKNKADVATANKLLDEVNEEIALAVNKKVPIKDISKSVQRQLGLTHKDVREASVIAGRKPSVPTPKEARVLAEAIEARKAPIKSGGSGQFLDDFLGVLSTRIGNISPRILGGVRKFEFNSHVRVADMITKVNPFLTKISKLPAFQQALLNKSLANGDFAVVESIIQRTDPSMLRDFRASQDVLAELYDGLKEAGYDTLGMLDNYWPRFVKDRESLLGKLDRLERKQAERALENRAIQLKTTVNALDPEERDDVLNKFLRGYLPKSGEAGISSTKARSITRLNDDLIKDYYTASESMHLYIRRAVGDIEKRKFFGRGTDLEGNKLNLEKSIGNLVQEQMSLGKINGPEADELSRLLRARFDKGEQSPSRLISDMRNIGYMTTITNPYSAVTQIGDIGVSSYVNGFSNTIASMFGTKAVKLSDLGLDNVIAQEFSNVGTTANALNKLFTASGFRMVDRFGKTTLLNGAFKKATAMTKNFQGVEKIRGKYGESFGDEFPSLIDDLASGRMTDNVKLYLWNELSGVQPISLSEMPLKYLEVPNGRILYALKTFGLKQLDVIRRDMVQQWNKGNKTEALKNAARYSVLVGTAGATVDQVKGFMSGQPPSIEELPDSFVEGLFKTFAAGQYMREKYLNKGDVADYAVGLVAPPVDWMNAIGSDIIGLVNGEKDIPDETLRQLPLIGKAWHMFFGGGLEKLEEDKMKEMFDES